MSRENGIEEPADINSHDITGSRNVVSESNEFQHISDSDYAKSLDELDPVLAEQVLSLIAEEHRYEYKRARWALLERAFEIAAVIVILGAIAFPIIYLFIRGEKGAAQTILTSSNVILVLTTLWLMRTAWRDNKITLRIGQADKLPNGDKDHPGGHSE